MNLLRLVKCLCCLVKCSKYLYFVKKIVCVMAVLLTSVFVFSMIPDVKSMLKKSGVKI